MTETFLGPNPSVEDSWRAIVRIRWIVSSYRFALARTLLDLKPASGQLVPIEDLALPFAAHICEHLRVADRQGTFLSSRFLDACRRANAGQITQDELRETFLSTGVDNLIDAFHFFDVGAEVPIAFFTVERTDSANGIRMTDAFAALLERDQSGSLAAEVESRWREVETAWEQDEGGFEFL